MAGSPSQERATSLFNVAEEPKSACPRRSPELARPGTGTCLPGQSVPARREPAGQAGETRPSRARTNGRGEAHPGGPRFCVAASDGRGGTRPSGARPALCKLPKMLIDLAHNGSYPPGLDGRNHGKAVRGTEPPVGFQRTFATEDACSEHLCRMRWPESL